VEAVRDGYLCQNVNAPTRGRGSDKPSLLDLVFTRDKEMINSVNHAAPIGKSDHVLLEIDLCPVL